MQRVLELARNGLGYVSPNPLVGCVIIHQGKVIGEGWHQKYGGPHAEVNAVRTVSNKALLRESTLYVNLEPCSHHGKTPPCTDLIQENSLMEVHFANKDPNPLVAGSGLNKLKDAGIKVRTGILQKEGMELNKRFFTFFKKKRPYIILKWAETNDGFLARSDYTSRWISNQYSRKLVHKWRSEEDAILVGSNTVKYDNPQLTLRDWPGRNAIRIFIDRDLKLPQNLKIFDKSQPTICYNLKKNGSTENFEWVKLPQKDFLQAVLKDLHTRGTQSLIVEGGATLLSEFINAELWDEARIFIGSRIFGKGISAPRIHGISAHDRLINSDKLKIIINPNQCIHG